MALRRREKRTERSKIDATPPWDQRRRADPDPTTGPFDERDAPEDEQPRVDLGALRVPMVPGLDLRLDMNEAQQVIAVTLANPQGSVQLGVFAAPRNDGIWPDVRREIADSIREQRSGQVEDAEGPWGAELVGQLKADNGGAVPVRFAGVDGPRWLLRATFVGQIVLHPELAEPFEQAVKHLVVVRGLEPMPAREPVPLRLPKEMTAPAPDGA